MWARNTGPPLIDAGRGKLLLIILPRKDGTHGAEVGVLLHEHGRVHEFDAQREGQLVRDLEGKVRVQRNGLQADVLKIEMSRPVIGIGIAEAETGEKAHAAPEPVAELVREIEMRIGPRVRVHVGGTRTHIPFGVDRARGLDESHTDHHLRPRQLGDPGGVPRHGGGVVRATDHASGKSRASRAEVGQGKAFRPRRSVQRGRRKKTAGKQQGDNPFHSRPCFVKS